MLIYILAYYLWNFCQLHNDPAVIWLRYHQFMALYQVDPERYRLDDGCVLYDAPDKMYYIYFKNVFDYIRISWMLKHRKQSQIRSKRLEYAAGYINEVKKKLHEKELEEARSWEHVI